MVCALLVIYTFTERWSRSLSDGEAMVAVQAAAAEEWGGIMVMLVVGHGNQPCRVFQKLELEKHTKTLLGAAFHPLLFHEQQ
ncbi:hypothetical protein DKX38_020355 [Salix brachista]|uniref:Uncharacterized protein n=1 Tax=Salix brachista TaxID=2182728 RepID=A0A5N5K591_9ROSI|nr:hypothetical protein DKX38_020355 [Salix brachista]